MNQLPLANQLPMVEPCAPGWYPLCLDRDVCERPRRFLIGDVPYVGYRRAQQVVVHLDRCPHRNVPLSSGRIIDGCLECPYHGWRFDAEGKCALIPGRIPVPKASHRVAHYRTHVHHGIVFIGLDVAQDSMPFAAPESMDDRYQHLVRKVVFPGSMFGVVENALDVPHTSVLHRGLFRTSRRHQVEVEVRRYQSWIEAEYLGEPPPQGLVGRLLSTGKNDEVRVEHFDRFFLPGVIQVEYRMGPRAHLVITGYLRPQDQETTEMYVQVSVKTPLWRWVQRIVLFFVEPFARLILGQDMSILRAQADNLKRFKGPRFMSTELDVMYAGVSRLLKEAMEVEQGNWPQRRDSAQEPREAHRFFMES